VIPAKGANITGGFRVIGSVKAWNPIVLDMI
jgi:hypothetical protein